MRKKQTSSEETLWKELRNKNLGVKFKRQYSLGNYVTDFYCPETKLAVELHGSVHKSDSAHKYDLGRLEYFESLGVRTLVFWNDQVEKDLKFVVEKITRYLSPVPSHVTGEGRRGEV